MGVANKFFKKIKLTFPLRNERAVANTFGATTLLSVSKVWIALDNGDGMEKPCKFSARTRNT